jgi:hypothetical protein
MSWEWRAANDIELRYSTDVTAGLNELFKLSLKSGYEDVCKIG